MKGCHATEMPSYLDKFMWKERFGKTVFSETFAGILQRISCVTSSTCTFETFNFAFSS